MTIPADIGRMHLINAASPAAEAAEVRFYPDTDFRIIAGSDSNFRGCFANEMLTRPDGEAIGAAQRRCLHDLLDLWIDRKLAEPEDA